MKFLTCCGILAYMLCCRISQTRLTTLGRVLLTTAEWAAILAVIWVMYNRNTRNWQFTSILLLTVGVGISFSTESLSSSIVKNNRLTDFFGEYSMGLYLTHHMVRSLYNYKFPDDSVRYSFHKDSFYLNCLILAFLFTIFMQYFFKTLPVIKTWLKRILVEKEHSISPACVCQLETA